MVNVMSKALRFLISRHFQAVVLFAIVFTLVSMQAAAPVRTKPCPFIVFAASSTGDLLASWNGANVVNVYQTDSMQLIASYNPPKVVNIMPVCFSKNGQYLLTTAEANAPDAPHRYPITIWNLKDPTKSTVVPGDAGHNSFAFSPDSTRLVAADDYRGNSSEKSRYTMSIWNVVTGERIHKLAAGHQAMITHVDWSADGTRIASASTEGIIRLWDAQTGLEIMSMQTDLKAPFSRAWCSFDGKSLFGVDTDHRLACWNTETGKPKSQHLFSGYVVGYYRCSLESDIVEHQYSNEKFEVILKDYDKWLPGWVKQWLQKRMFRSDLYRCQPMTDSLTKIMTLPPNTNTLAVLPDTQEMLTYERGDYSNDGQLAWYSLDQSYAWIKPLCWAAAIAAGYWLLLSPFAWRRKRPVFGSPLR